MCRRAGRDRVHVFDVENHAGTPVYVHAKVCVVDDIWASVGSDNFNRRSWTHDSELSSAVLDTTRDEREPRDPAGTGDGARAFARDLRLTLAREHLDLDPDGADDDLLSTPTGSWPRWRHGPPPWTPGTPAAGADRGRPAGCARTTRALSRGSTGSGRPRSTGCSTTPTAARCAAAEAGVLTTGRPAVVPRAESSWHRGVRMLRLCFAREAEAEHPQGGPALTVAVAECSPQLCTWSTAGRRVDSRTRQQASIGG